MPLPSLRRFLSYHNVLTTFTSCFIAIVIAALAILFSSTNSGASDKRFLSTLDDTNGIFFLGHLLKIDIAGRSVSVSWLLGGCGSYRLKDANRYKPSNCGPINIPVNVHINGAINPSFSYDPSIHPIDATAKNHIVYVQAMNQFQSTHLLNIYTQEMKIGANRRYFEQQYFYPFESFLLEISFLALNSAEHNATASLPIVHLGFTDYVNSFVPTNEERPTQSMVNGTLMDSRRATLRIVRTTTAQTFVMMLFVVNWALTLMVLYITVVALVSKETKMGEGILILPVTVILTLPALRALFVESPPFGIVIDVLGLFMQMIIVSICSLILLIGVSLRSVSRFSAPIQPILVPLPTSKREDEEFLLPDNNHS